MTDTQRFRVQLGLSAAGVLLGIALVGGVIHSIFWVIYVALIGLGFALSQRWIS